MTSAKLPIIFIHGMFMNSKSWQQWQEYFSQNGYSTHSIDWPFHVGTPSELRSKINPALGKLTFSEVLTYLTHEIQKISPKAILIGHSMGGLLVQKLISNGIGSAGVCISSAAPMGIITFQLSFYKSGLPLINPLAGNSVYVMPKPHFHYTFCNTLSRRESDLVYDQFLCPESRNVGRTSTLVKINFKQPHVPLLFISGKQDTIIPFDLVNKTAKAYSPQSGIVQFEGFDHRGHFICGEPGWEAVAQRAENFLDRNL